jgi:hypothetical protein
VCSLEKVTKHNIESAWQTATCRNRGLVRRVLYILLYSLQMNYFYSLLHSSYHLERYPHERNIFVETFTWIWCDRGDSIGGQRILGRLLGRCESQCSFDDEDSRDGPLLGLGKPYNGEDGRTDHSLW